MLCGLVASQIDTITSDVNSVATLFTNDVYRNLKRRQPTQRELLFVVRLSSVLCGVLMLAMAWALQYTDTGAVNLNLAVVGILDMPLFVITIVYGLFWRRTNWQGAAAGFVAGGIVGRDDATSCSTRRSPATRRVCSPICPRCATRSAAWNADLSPYQTWLRSIAPISSSLTALIVTPIVSLLTPPNRRASAEQIWSAYRAGGADRERFRRSRRRSPRRHLPSHPHQLARPCRRSRCARRLRGIPLRRLLGRLALPFAGELAIGGMLAVFAGGLVRVYKE